MWNNVWPNIEACWPSQVNTSNNPSWESSLTASEREKVRYWCFLPSRGCGSPTLILWVPPGFWKYFSKYSEYLLKRKERREAEKGGLGEEDRTSLISQTHPLLAQRVTVNSLWEPCHINFSLFPRPLQGTASASFLFAQTLPGSLLRGWIVTS